MITFKNYIEGETNIKNINDEHVLGFMVTDHASEREYLYAVTQHGKAYRADAPIRTPFFDCKNRTFWEVTTVPPNAEYIGNYPMPKKLAKAI